MCLKGFCVLFAGWQAFASVSEQYELSMNSCYPTNYDRMSELDKNEKK